MHAMTKLCWRRTALLFFGAAGAVPMAARPSPAQQITYSGSLQGTTGDYYFTKRTTNLAFYNQLGAQLGRFRFSTSIPLVYQNTPWVTFGGVGPVPSGGPEHAMVGDQIRQRRHGGSQTGQQGARTMIVVTVPDTGSYSQVGIGDPVFGGDFEVLSETSDRPAISFTGGIKAPVGSTADGFSTGQWDYSAGLGVARTVGRTLFFLDGAYWVLGDMPGLPLRDVMAYSAALGRVVGDGGWTVLGSVAGSQATIDGIDPSATVGLTVNRRFVSGRALYGSLSAGLTSSSPDFGVSVGWHIPLSRTALPPTVADRAR